MQPTQVAADGMGRGLMYACGFRVSEAGLCASGFGAPLPWYSRVSGCAAGHPGCALDVFGLVEGLFHSGIMMPACVI